MLYLSRRNFLKSACTVGTSFFLNTCFYNSFLEDYSNNFICQNFYLMGTCGKIQIFCDNLDQGKFFISKAIDRIKALEFFFTKFSPLSDIGRINMSPLKFNEVSDDTLNILKIGNFISMSTFRFFDMGLGNVLSYYGIDSLVPIVGNITTLIDMKDDLFKFDDNFVLLNRKNSMVDLGGIGKGFAIDQSLNVLINGGINHIAIEFGGDIKVFGGMPNNLPWRIVFDKHIFNDYNYLDVFNGAVAVSGKYIKKSAFLNKCHIINPYILSSNDRYLFLLVSGPECTICDALSTAFFNMDIDAIDKSIFNFPLYNYKLYF